MPVLRGRRALTRLSVEEFSDPCIGQDNVDDFAAVYEPLSKERFGKLSVRILQRSPQGHMDMRSRRTVLSFRSGRELQRTCRNR